MTILQKMILFLEEAYLTKINFLCPLWIQSHLGLVVYSLSFVPRDFHEDLHYYNYVTTMDY